jgi:hypothetical protein
LAGNETMARHNREHFAARGVLTTPDGRAADLAFERVAAGRLLARVPLESTWVAT